MPTQFYGPMLVKPCLNCQAPPDPEIGHDPQIGCFWIECSTCFTEAGDADTVEDALDNWNDRIGVILITRNSWSKVK